MSHQIEILKKICCDSEGATGCAVSLGNAARLLQLGLVCLTPTKEGIEYLTGEAVLSPAQVEQWIHGMRVRKLVPVREKRKTIKQLKLEEAVRKAEDADREWRERRVVLG